MKLKRMLFVIFTCVFALYGCVSAKADNAFLSTTANNEISVSKNIEYSPELLMPFVNSDVQVDAFQAYARKTVETRLYTSVRDAKGIIVTKNDIDNITSKIVKDAREKKAKEDAEAARLAELKRLEEEAMSVFSPKITTYGVDCYGCQSIDGRGGTAMGVVLDLNLGVQLPDGSWQAGIKYGDYYIIAADRSVPMCSIVKIEDHGLAGAGIDPNAPFYAMVLDRGGGVSGHHLDLYTGSESNSQVYRVTSGNPKAQIIRMGGQSGKSCTL